VIPLHDDNPTQRTPIVTIILIGISIAVFLYQVNLPQEAAELFAFQYGAIPAIVFGQASLPEEAVAIPVSLTLVTSMFLHGGWMHLLGNMLYLWIFGNNIEDAMGHTKFVVFYILSGILAALSHACLRTKIEVEERIGLEAASQFVRSDNRRAKKERLNK
jgi:membrane associated rhomboid family serine protease